VSESKLGRILVVDDEVELVRALCTALSDAHYDVVGKYSGAEAIQALKEQDFDLLLSDLMMPQMNGLQVLRKAKELAPDLFVVILTGQGTVPDAVEAMKAGAFDFILKPFKMDLFQIILKRAMDMRRLHMKNVRLEQYVRHHNQSESDRYRLVGSSPQMQKVVRLIEKVAPTPATVLIRGPSGSGKEVVARSVHRCSSRSDQPLVTINCAALQETLLESELFGYEKGAHSTASQMKRGLVEVAEGGTLFIDEVAEMSPSMQAKLLRVLENGHYRRVGGTQDYYTDLRIIAATNKPLEEEQKAGRFREDLFHRLNVFTMTLPGLKDHREDIPELVTHILETRRVKGGKDPCSVDPKAMQLLLAYDWPGNIRELVNVLERAQILAENNLITPDDLPDNIIAAPTTPLPVPDSPLDLHAMERKHVLQVLQRNKGNKAQTAKDLGISRRGLYHLIQRYQLEREGADGEGT
jgi:DNA-binding NtrC family response regulator